uniref:BPTI/Kunitz inhibitor domain-containing protein n=1 Tax=Moschus moschiferus TaxID=68415 RepID=A0A8C6FH83_MOSMO
MNRLCLFAAFFFLLVILVDSTPGYEQHTQDQGYGITCGRRNEKHSGTDWSKKKFKPPYKGLNLQSPSPCWLLWGEWRILTGINYQQLTTQSIGRFIENSVISVNVGVQSIFRETNIGVQTASRPAFCLKPKIIGPCKGKKIRYFYDAKTGHCQHFFYGGCKGNLNNFYTMAQCMKTCCHAAGSRK